jgi:hypothetical protein
MDLLERFPRAWCDTCETVRPIVLDVMKAKEKHDHDAADIVCEECKSILVTLHAPSAARSWRAYQEGCESIGDGGPRNRSSDRPISTRRRTATPQTTAYKGSEGSSETFAAAIALNPSRVGSGQVVFTARQLGTTRVRRG